MLRCFLKTLRRQENLRDCQSRQISTLSLSYENLTMSQSKPKKSKRGHLGSKGNNKKMVIRQ